MGLCPLVLWRLCYVTGKGVRKLCGNPARMLCIPGDGVVMPRPLMAVTLEEIFPE